MLGDLRMSLQNSAVSGVVYDHIYPYLHNTLKAAVKPVCNFHIFMIYTACICCVCDICDFSFIADVTVSVHGFFSRLVLC